MLSMPLPESKWQIYNRGFEKAFKAVCIVGLCVLFFRLLILPAQWIQNYPELGWLAALLYFFAIVAFFVLAPFLVADSKAGPENRIPFEKIEPMLDHLIEDLQIDWNHHYLVEVYDHLRHRRRDEARRLFYLKSGLSWDKTDKSLEEWQETVLETKHAAIRSHLHLNRTESVPAAAPSLETRIMA